MDLTFVSVDKDDIHKRKRQLACVACRKRKKRCFHNGNELSSRIRKESTQPRSISSNQQPTSRDLTPATTREDTGNLPETTSANTRTITPSQSLAPIEARISTSQDRDENEGQEAPRHSRVWRFVGFSNPEVMFRFSDIDASQAPGNRNRVGVWQSQHERASYISHDESPTAGDTPESAHITNFRQASDMHIAMRPLLLAECYAILPPFEDQLALTEMYFAELHELLPILDEKAFRQSLETKSVSIMLMQAVCLVIAKGAHAARHLKLSGGDLSPLSSVEFCRNIYKAICTGLSNGFEEDKLTLIRILALITLHVEGPDGAEESSLHLMQAIHHSNTLGLHLDKGAGSEGSEVSERLFWCLWSLDRLNACIHGRPIMIHDRDIGVQLRRSYRPNLPAFDIWLKLAGMIDRVIELYRPTDDPALKGWDDRFPDFEEIVRKCQGFSLSPRTIMTLELFYHTVAILSSTPNASSSEPLRTVSSVRQRLATFSVVTIITENYPRDLAPLPTIPYALSLALSVAYKQFRQTGLITTRLRAARELDTRCNLLDKVSKTWISATTMTDLGKRALRKAKRVYPVLNNSSEVINVPISTIEPANSHEPRRPSTDRRGEKQAQQGTQPFQIATNVPGIPEKFVQQSEIPHAAITPDNVELYATSNSMDGFSQYDPNVPFELDAAFEGFDDMFGGYLNPSLATNFGDYFPNS